MDTEKQGNAIDTTGGMACRMLLILSESESATIVNVLENSDISHQQKKRSLVCKCRHYIQTTIMIPTFTFSCMEIHLVVCRV